MTFFTALLALSIKWESKNLHCIFLKPTISDNFAKKVDLYERWFWLGSQRDPNPENFEKNLKDSGAAIFFKNWFVFYFS